MICLGKLATLKPWPSLLQTVDLTAPFYQLADDIKLRSKHPAHMTTDRVHVPCLVTETVKPKREAISAAWSNGRGSFFQLNHRR